MGQNKQKLARKHLKTNSKHNQKNTKKIQKIITIIVKTGNKRRYTKRTQKIYL